MYFLSYILQATIFHDTHYQCFIIIVIYLTIVL
jgi:hypothetical protein